MVIWVGSTIASFTVDYFEAFLSRFLDPIVTISRGFRFDLIFVLKTDIE